MNDAIEKPPSAKKLSLKRWERRQCEKDDKTRPYSHRSEYEEGPSKSRKDRQRRSRSWDRNRSKEQQNDAEDVLKPSRATFEIGEDFVPFDIFDSPPPSSEKHDEHHNEDRSRRRESGGRKREDRDRDRGQPVREWDRGKGTGKARDWEHGDREGTRGNGGRRHNYPMTFDMDEVYANQRKNEAQFRKAPWVAGVDWDSCINVAQMLHREVEAFVKYISPTPVEDELRGLIVTLVSRAVTQAFPDAKVLPFGSYETKLYLPLGDIDLVIQSDSMAYSDKVTVLRALASTLKRARITSNVTIIAKAKVPIIKFVTTHGRFNVDISINQGNGVIAGQIVNGFLDEMDGGGMALRSLVMIIKAFLTQRGMNEVFTGGLGSYSIVCLAVSFLQMHPKIRRKEISAERNLGVLVIEFFELYGCYFNYEEVGISVRNGGMYYSKRQRGWMDYHKSHLLSIEDPTDPSNDISKGSYGISKVRATLAGAHGILTAAAYLRANILSSRREGRSYSLREQSLPEDLSILSSVLGVTQETINHRRLVEEVFEQRTLHHLLDVAPKATIVPSDPPPQQGLNGNANGHPLRPPSSTRPSRAAESVQAAWEEADMELGSDDNQPPLKKISKAGERKRREDEDEEDGRYDIGRHPPPRKRRKTGNTQQDLHTVFTTDEDEDGSIADRLDDESIEKEEREYDLEDKGADSRTSRRSYWLSKGGNLGGDSD